MKKLIIFGALILTACESFEHRVCMNATDGLPTDNYENCFNEAQEARYKAVQQVAQKYRNISR